MRKIAGFTLIELLVTIGIILMITGGGIAGFISFNDKQNVTTTVKDIQTMMRAAQIKARAGEGASDCDLALADSKLRGYEVALSGSPVDSLVMNSVCVYSTNPPVKVPRDASTVTLDGVSVEFSNDPTNAVEFLALKGGTTTGHPAPDPLVVTVSGSGNTYTFEVHPGGEITEGEFTP